VKKPGMFRDQTRRSFLARVELGASAQGCQASYRQRLAAIFAWAFSSFDHYYEVRSWRSLRCSFAVAMALVPAKALAGLNQPSRYFHPMCFQADIEFLRYMMLHCVSQQHRPYSDHLTVKIGCLDGNRMT
jgi:hypothetical protein